MKVLYKGVGTPPERVEISDSLSGMKAILGGTPTVLFYNPEIMVIGAIAPNAAGRPCNGYMLGQCYCGPLLITGSKNGRFCEMPEELLKKYASYFRQ